MGLLKQVLTACTTLVALLEPFSSSGYTWQLMIGLFVLAIAVHLVIRHNGINRRFAVLGGSKAPEVPHWAPLGMDLAYTSLREMNANHYFEYTREFLNHTPGRTVEFNMLGNRMVMTDNPENIKEMMHTQFSAFGKGDVTNRIFANCFDGSIFGTEVPDWATHRALLRPHVAKDRPTDASKLEKHFQRMVDRLPSDNPPLDAYHVLDAFMCDAVVDIFLDPESDPDFVTPEPEPFLKGVHILFKYNTFRVAVGKISLLLPDIIYHRSTANALYEYLDVHIARIRKIQKTNFRSKPEKEWTVLESLASENASTKHYRSQLISLLSAAKDPLGLMVLWVIYEMNRNPEILRRFRAEILATLGPDQDVIPSVAQLKGMSYMQNILKEVMRLYHPFGFNVRCPNIDTILPTGGGVDGTEPIPILKETMVVANIMGVHRRPDLVGADAGDFNPDRWLTYNPDPWEYMPFNRGPRNCLGQVFARFSMSYVLVRLYQKFDIIATDQIEQKIMIEMNTRMSDPIMVRFKQRKEDDATAEQAAAILALSGLRLELQEKAAQDGNPSGWGSLVEVSA